MLPFLPALILLLLQGPSGMERLSVNGRAPSQQEAVHQILCANRCRLSAQEEEVLAALLAANADTPFSHVFFTLLGQSGLGPQFRLIREDEGSIGVAEFQRCHRPTPGFSRSDRTRDGPMV